MGLPRRDRVPSHTTAWAPATENLHRAARRKLAESRDLQRVTKDDLADQRGQMVDLAQR